MGTQRSSGHINKSAFAALLQRTGETQSAVATRAGVSPQQVRDMASGRRLGRNTDVRVKLAEGLDVPVEAITCWCSDRRCR